MDLFPVELWEKVLENLEEDPRDLLNASETCVLFHDLLEDKIGACRLEEVLPLVMPWLETQDLLNCRRISKRILRSVDRTLDNFGKLSYVKNMGLIRSRYLPAKLPPSFEYSRFEHLYGKIEVPLETLQKITRFQEELKGSLEREHGRPFVGKRLSLNRIFNWPRLEFPNGGAAYNRDLLEAGIQLMAQFQTKLAHIVFNVGILDTSGIETYDIFRRIFVAVPNLETFRVEMMGDRGSSLEDLQRFITRNAVPVMPRLKRLSFLNFQVAVPILQEFLTKCGGQLEALLFLTLNGLWASVEENPEYLSDQVNQLPQLVELRLSLDLRMQRLLLNMEAPSLISLALDLRTSGNPPMSLVQLIPIFKSFPNLVDLHLNLSPYPVKIILPVEGEHDPFEDGLNQHRNLKNLTLRTNVIVNGLMRFFVELFSGLETFSMELGCVDEFGGPGPDQDLNLMFQGRGYESQLWTLGRSLRTVQIGRGRNWPEKITLTREVYNQQP